MPDLPGIPSPSSLIPNPNPVSSALGLAGPVSSATSFSGTLPWNVLTNPSGQPNSKPVANTSSGFFVPLAPKGELWDKLVPYRLVVIDTSKGNQVVSGIGARSLSDVQVNPLGNGTLAFEPLSRKWEIFLPITPQQLSITDAYAINTSATLRGILEEHSGTRFKNITIQGSFGVWPGRPSIALQPGTPNLLQSVFGGTITAAQNVATQFTSIINNITNGSNASKPTTVRPGDTTGGPNGAGDPEQGLGTGYYQTLMFTQFLEQYTEAKKNPNNASWRLVFDIPKQNQSFVVTPVGFTWNENVNHPMEINYNLQLKAWRRINLNDTLQPVPLQVTQLTPGVLQKILNTIQAAQNTAAAAVNLIGAVRSDVDNILNIIRQTGLLVKGLAGVAIAASDLPSQLVTDTQSTISQFLATVSPTNLFGPAATDATTLSALAAITALAGTNEGLTTTNVNNNQLGPSAIASSTLNPSNAVFTSPLQYPLLLGQVPVANLTLNSQQQNALQTEVNNVGDFTVANLKTMRGTILTLCLQLSNSFGAGNAYYDTLFNQPPPVSRDEPMTLDEFDILSDFYALLEAYDILTATNQLDNNQILNNMEYVSALATTSGIEFSISNSKIQVPVPYGLNIEQISSRYLNDPQRWLEIATLNELREPYIDENGFVLPLLSNANGRSIVIGSNEDLFIGQTVYLNSTTQSPTARTILNIETLSEVSFLLTLDGLSNLDVFTTVDQAYIQAYLPGTVNSQNVIFVPSDLEAPEYDQISIPATVANVNLVGLSKVSWLLNSQGDLAINNTGDFRYAAGITNIIQALAIKFGTQFATDLLNPTFGLSVNPGRMVSDTSAAAIYNEIVNLITADPRFSGVSGLQVNIQPPGVSINLGVELAGISGVFPIAFTLPTTT
jgi:hypothetical protein